MSKRQAYKLEVLEKIKNGQDYYTTSIPISKRDKHSILRELGVKISLSPSRNISTQHINWDKYRALEKDGKYTLRQYIRLIKKNEGVKPTTIRYHLREIHSKFEHCTEYELYDKLKQQYTPNIEQRLKLVDIDNIYVGELTRDIENFSVGELAFILDLPIHLMCRAYAPYRVTEWAKMLSNYNPRHLQYRVDFGAFLDDIGRLKVADSATKYRVAQSTVKKFRSWK